MLCPGPSLLKHPFEALDGYDLKIGVNRAPVILHNFYRLECDWWCAADAHLIEQPKYQPQYPARLFTMAESDIRVAHPKADLLFEDCFPRFKHEGKWECFSMTAAMILAAHHSAQRIDVYGADMLGTSDADGHEYDFPNAKPKQWRNEWRWENERIKWDLTVKLLSDQDIEVRRMN